MFFSIILNYHFDFPVLSFDCLTDSNWLVDRFWKENIRQIIEKQLWDKGGVALFLKICQFLFLKNRRPGL